MPDGILHGGHHFSFSYMYVAYVESLGLDGVVVFIVVVAAFVVVDALVFIVVVVVVFIVVVFLVFIVVAVYRGSEATGQVPGPVKK